MKEKVDAGAIDTVIVALPYMQGRLMGKRFQAELFVNTGWEETHGCNCLLATDMEMNTLGDTGVAALFSEERIGICVLIGKRAEQDLAL